MGDHKATIKISFDLHGKVYKMDSWINYSGHDGVDRRVIDFFEHSWNDAYARYQDEIYKSETETREKQKLEDEVKELARLKEKYEGAKSK